MPLEIDGLKDLGTDIAELFEKTDDGSPYYANMAKRALAEGGEVIAAEIRKNAAKARDTGTIYRSVKAYKVVRHRKRPGYTVKIGVKRSEAGGYYANPLEFGHSGPNGQGDPTPPHPFVRPAFDAKADEAYAKIKEELTALLFEKRNS